MGRFSRWGLPLLAKELTELSTHKRTYLVRVLYAVVLMLAAGTILFWSMPGRGVATVASLGSGFPVFYWMYYLQRQAMFLLLPIVSCGAFTNEKERNTLGLLFLTQLGPWTIIFEKLLSRLLLALFFLGISLPVISFAYALGGVSIDDLVVLFYSQLVTAIRIIAISLLCSAYCRTTFGALLASYVLIYMAGVVMSPLAILLIGVMNGTMLWSQVWMSLTRFPLYLMFYERPPLGIVSGFRGAGSNLPRTLVASVPALLVSTVSLLLARRYLVSRAFAAPSNKLRKVLARVDRFFVHINQNRWTRGIVLTREDHGIPDQDPVAWRETHTRSLGQVRYLVRWLLVVELPVLLTLYLATELPDRHVLPQISQFILMVFWIILLIVTCVCSAGLISRERRQQTLDVLLTTPLHGREIIEQKMAGLRRIIWVCEIPMWTCLGFYMVGFHQDEPFALQFIFSQASMLLVYPWLVAWIAMGESLRCKTSVMALLRTLQTSSAYCIIPLVAVMFLWYGAFHFSWMLGADYEWNREFRQTTVGAMLFSPATLFAISLDRNLTNEFHFFNQHGLPFAWLPNSAIHAAIFYWLRKRCLSQADKLLGRTPELAAEAAAVESV